MGCTCFRVRLFKSETVLLNTIGDVVGFNMEDGPIIAIDGNKNHMYAIIQPVPLGPSTFVNSTECEPKCIAATFCCKDPSVK